MVTVKVSSKGQLVLPKSIRERFGIEPGDKVEIIEMDNELILVPIKKGTKLRGLVKFNKSIKEILDEARKEEAELEAKK